MLRSSRWTGRSTACARRKRYDGSGSSVPIRLRWSAASWFPSGRLRRLPGMYAPSAKGVLLRRRLPPKINIVERSSSSGASERTAKPRAMSSASCAAQSRQTYGLGSGEIPAVLNLKPRGRRASPYRLASRSPPMRWSSKPQDY